MSPEELNEYPIFKDFDLAQIVEILKFCELKQFNSGQVLIAPGSLNEMLYLLVSGELRIVIENEESKITFPIEPGECIGEMSLVMNLPVSALVVGHQNGKVLCIPQETFWDKIMMTQQGVRNLFSILAARLKRSNLSLMKKIEEQFKYQHFRKELETAAKIQSSIIPDGADLLPLCAEVDAYAFMNQARDVGGDFFDALKLDDDQVFFAIGDVSGKGMPAALFMMRTFTSLRMLISNKPKFEEVIPALNELLVLNNEDMIFVSLFVGLLNLRTGVFQYVNGGHNPPFVSKKGNEFTYLPVGKGKLLGILSKADYSVSEILLEPGDSIVLYTDGITEAMNDQDQMFTSLQTQKVLNRKLGSPTKNLVQTLERAIQDFVASAPQYDDLTLLAFRYLGENRSE